MQLISLRACGLSEIMKWAVKEIFSKEVDSSKLLFERFGMEDDGLVRSYK